MLQRTFVHVHGIGYQTERRLWRQGADCWDTLLARPGDFQVPEGRKAALLDMVARSRGALARGDYRFFQRALAPRDHWRAWRAFPGRVAYLDIETDGGRGPQSVTVVGISDGVTLRQFVRGENLLDFPDALDEAAVLVTFFGGGFDLPVLRQTFPRLRFDQLHLDLCPAFRNLGFRGGLKRIEAELGIERSPATRGLTGWDAVRLWRQWLRGSEEARDLLLAYNAEDVMNMAPLAEIACDLLERCALSADRRLRGG